MKHGDRIERLREICTNRIGSAIPNPDLTEALTLLDELERAIVRLQTDRARWMHVVDLDGIYE